MPIVIKICGLRTPEALDVSLHAGADMVGFVFFPPSPRHIDFATARLLGARVRGRAQKVALSVDADDELLAASIEALAPDMLQLHGSEQPGFDAGRPVMKVLKIRDGNVPDADDWPDPIMLDSWSLDQRGGTGRTWDWDLARELLAKRHVFIAGGLEPGNVGKVVSSFKPYGVDVSSGVEASVRIKDPDKVRAFVHAVRLSEILN